MPLPLQGRRPRSVARTAMVLGIRPEHFSRANDAAPRPGQVPLHVLIDLVRPDRDPHLRRFELAQVKVSAELRP